MTAKPKMQWGPGKMKRVSVRKRLSEEEGQRYTPIYVTFFLKQDISLISYISK